MTHISLQAMNRTLKGYKNFLLREQNQIPAVVYGTNISPTMISVDRNQFIKVYKEAGESSLVELSIDGKDAMHVLIQDYQKDPVRNEVIHIDFRSVDMNVMIETSVALQFIGESSAVKVLNGTFVSHRDEVQVKCLPSKLVKNIEIDISSIKTFDDNIRIQDISVPEGMQIMDDSDTVIASVSAPRSEEELAALDKAVELDVNAVKVDKKEKVDEEEKSS